MGMVAVSRGSSRVEELRNAPGDYNVLGTRSIPGTLDAGHSRLCVQWSSWRYWGMFMRMCF
ncbi:hypothetical protein DPMN_109784 [Dreissena polymorpha]|uniref:Uncharacterized protein n=1 Tax=Dreissena polymorpha TaxID=45954 RepID=A0A9D4QMI0_DREPO|nr:hypothetical protein DPMN_109784 [Dreissena polymorpha]